MPLDFDALTLGPCHAAFGEVNRGFPVPVYTPAGGSPFTIDGVFRLPDRNLMAFGDEPGVMSRKPELDIRMSQVPAGPVLAQMDTVTVRGVNYIVSDIALDGNGLATLSLSESP